MPTRSPTPIAADKSHLAVHPASQAADTLQGQRQELLRAVAEISAQGWCQGTAGNFSLTLSRQPLRLLITPSGKNKRRLEPADLIVVDAGGEPVDTAKARPSAEALLHGTLARLTGAGSVLHTHSVAATLLGEHFVARRGFTLTGYEMLKGLEGIRSHQARVFIPVLANSQDMPALAGQVKALLGDSDDLRGFLLAGHGLYTWGETLEAALRHVEILEFLFECVARRTRVEPFEP